MKGAGLCSGSPGKCSAEAGPRARRAAPEAVRGDSGYEGRSLGSKCHLQPKSVRRSYK